MTPRYSERITVQCPVIFAMGSMVGDGRIHNLTLPGCLIHSTIHMKKGEYLQLKIFLPGVRPPCSVALAAVRWSNAAQFGVEFIKMSEPDTAVLNRIMAAQCPKSYRRRDARNRDGDPSYSR